MNAICLCHRSKLVSDFVKKNIKMLDWPGNSPDLNPNENLWTILKDKIANKYPTSTKDLEMALKRILIQKITAQYCKHLVHSMSCRLQAVIKTKVDIPKTRFLNKNRLM